MRPSISWLLIFALAGMACGKRDDPTPPVPVIPAATSDLVVAQRGQQLVLAWSFPTLTSAGTNLPGVDRIEVLRHIQTLPPDLPGVDDMPTAGTTGAPWEREMFRKVAPPSDAVFQRDADVIATLDRDRIPGAVSGSRIMYTDVPSFRPDGRPVRITYSVRTHFADASSEPGNRAEIIPLEVSGPPRNLVADASAAGVVLTWDAPADADEHQPVGYFVYRLTAEGTAPGGPEPVNSAPVTDTTYTDLPPFGTWTYAVTAVRDVGPPPVESAHVGPVESEFRDLQPPPQPTDVVTLLGEQTVRLLWEGVDAGDVAGYHVYRALEGQTATRLTTSPQPATEFSDTPPAGASYVYSVTAVDNAGNESSPAAAAPVLIPR